MTYNNPIIPGFNPDPSICRVENDYYLVTSTFQYFPGVPIYHSQDLVNWEHIGNVLDRPELVPGLDKTLINGGIWAPTLRYHDGVFYMVTTMVFVDKAYNDFQRWKNFFVTATSPKGPWSDPIFFDYPGYDTSLFIFDKDHAYVQGSFYHRIRKEISQSKIDLRTGHVTEPRRIWSGTGEKAPEAPHVLYKDGWYYLVIAEGGTEAGHRVAMARAKSIDAPEDEWEACPVNPILSHHDLPDELVQCTGHADFFQDTVGNWWIVFLASRVYDGERFPIGRETFLAPVDWSGEWPFVQRPIKAFAPKEYHGPNIAAALGTSKNLCKFGSRVHGWGIEWLWLRIPDMQKYQLTDLTDIDGVYHGCKISGSTANLASEMQSSSLVGIRQCHIRCRVTVDLELDTNADYAALVAYLDPLHHASVGVADNHILFSGERIPLPKESWIKLAIKADERNYNFMYSFGGSQDWHNIGTVDTRELSTGFTGVIFGIHVQGIGKSAHFKNFMYEIL
ncbi:hypothetical protein O0I10_010418 [Lichtheimia ornata]|uniref:Beta-xylosidase C-terminal Concanavalin A-like domain-containing protein n=1 Tax=Lichtheimia ornata TaxID=688661 RepID=A0AAD7UW71_9FUNG|nr:uncharacterized protein O0I10_010418 [Lichtheimia ornata]KAJ8653969.1 hypothetical protein O0I10_010418 [Lichtheimia ornata]